MARCVHGDDNALSFYIQPQGQRAHIVSVMLRNGTMPLTWFEGIVWRVWHCLKSVELFKECGIVWRVWHCLKSMALFEGIVWRVWHCLKSMALFEEYGIVWRVWHCLKCVALFEECGIVWRVWCCAMAQMPLTLFEECLQDPHACTQFKRACVACIHTTHLLNLIYLDWSVKAKATFQTAWMMFGTPLCVCMHSARVRIMLAHTYNTHNYGKNVDETVER